MRVSGTIGSEEYVKRYKNLPSFCDIDLEVAGLIAEGYCEWDTGTQKVHATALGHRELKSGTAH